MTFITGKRFLIPLVKTTPKNPNHQNLKQKNPGRVNQGFNTSERWKPTHKF